MSSSLRRLVVIALIVILGAAPTGLTRSTTSAAAATPAFGEPTVSGVQGTGFEEDLRLSPDGTAYTSAPGSLSSGTSFMWRSMDGGKTFKWAPAAQQPTGKLPSCIGGGDSELATDSGNNVYFNDLTLANFSTARSADHGTTFAPISCAAVSDTVVDRQWYAVDGNPTTTGEIFLTYDKVEQSAPVECSGGIAKGLANPGNNVLVLAQSPVPGGQAAAGTQFAPSQVISCDEGIMGNDEFYNYPDTGKRVFVAHDSASLSSVSVARCDVVPIGAGSPTGFANCTDVLVSKLRNAITGGNFPTLTIDRAGNLLVVWEQAPATFTTTTTGTSVTITGNTVLMFSTSSNEGKTWSRPSQLPTGTLQNNVFAWPAAGDSGRIDVAWYGTPAACDQTCVTQGGGPDHVNGDWSLWMSQTLNGGKSWTAPILASKHFIHRGTINTVMGGQSGNRTLGDFLQLRIGSGGEANISYADSNNQDGSFIPHAMFVRQNGGSSVFATPATVTGSAAPLNSVSDVAGDGTFDNLGLVSSNIPNLDILGSQVSMPDASHYQVVMKVADLTSLAPSPDAGGTDLVWLTQWHVPSQTDSNGGEDFFVYMESNNGSSADCYSGESAANVEGGGAIFTYPGTTQITGTACSYTATAPGTITITVPTANVSEANPISSRLYSVTASTMTLPGPANAVQPVAGVGGTPPNLVDVAPGYDFDPGVSTPPCC